MAKMGEKTLSRGEWWLEREYMLDNILTPYRLLREHIISYVFASQFVGNKVVLDVACGNGYGSSYLMSKGARRVIGGDMAQEAIAQAKEYYRKDGIEFILLDATRLPYQDDSFDAVVSFETIEHIAEYEKFLSECRRVLRDGGTFICSTPNVQTPGAEKAINPYHINEFSSEQLYHLLSGYFNGMKLFGQSFVNREKTDIKQRLANIVKTRLLWVPYIDKLIKLVTRFVFKEFRLVTLGEVEDFDSLWDENCRPIPLEDSPLTAGNTIAVARK